MVNLVKRYLEVLLCPRKTHWLTPFFLSPHLIYIQKTKSNILPCSRALSLALSQAFLSRRSLSPSSSSSTFVVEMTFEDGCSTGLVLSLGNSSQVKADRSLKMEQSRASGVRFDRLFPCTDLEPDLSLCLPNSGSSEEGLVKRQKKIDVNKFCEEKECSLASSCSPHISQPRVKREIPEAFSEDLETERLSSRASDEDEESNSRKKLRLSKEQSSLLEDSYREQSTPNPKRKQELAEQLNLRPRQVEVWFQNRRARTKLKQTEVDCEFLKRCCETLTDENRRLQKELQELKALKFSSPLYMQLPAATLTMCPSCERIATKETTTKGHFTMTPKTPFCNPFSHPSAAC